MSIKRRNMPQIWQRLINPLPARPVRLRSGGAKEYILPTVTDRRNDRKLHGYGRVIPYHETRRYALVVDGLQPYDKIAHKREIAAYWNSRYAASRRRKEQVKNSRSYVFKPANPQAKTKRTGGKKQRMHSKQRMMKATVMTSPDDMGLPMTGELIQPLRGREWASELGVPLVQAIVTGVISAAGAGIVLAISSELLDTVRAGLLEFGVIGGAAWFFQTIRNTRRYSFGDAIVEALPVGVLVAGGTAAYYLVVTGNWFTFWWGAAISGVVGFAGLAAQWFGFLGRSDDLLYAIERVINTDIDGDGIVGELPVEPNGVRSIPVNRGDDRSAVEVDNALPVNSHIWQSFAVAVLIHKCNISKTDITKLTGGKDWKYRKISQPAYGRIYRYCEKNGYIKTDSKTDSNILSEKGWRELSRWIPQGMEPNSPYPN
ncbi:MAG: hypothetical protein KDK05_23805 [Candidatus Competibacteraceae bacterium]|nr:hypothetical protein [Candidatus Competibacteraceae bacterium]